MQADHTADIDDTPIPLAHHQAGSCFGAEKRPLQVGKKHIVKVGFGHAHQQFIRGDARIVDENERYADLFLNFLKRGAAGVIVRNIPLLHISVDAVRAALLRHSLSLFDRGRTIDEDVEAVLRQLFRDCRANAAGTAGYDC